jgi:hypothetical protein
VIVALQYAGPRTYLQWARFNGRGQEGAWIMGIFSSLIKSRQRAANRRFAEHLAFLHGMTPRDRADIGLKAGQIETVARQMANK